MADSSVQLADDTLYPQLDPASRERFKEMLKGLGDEELLLLAAIIDQGPR